METVDLKRDGRRYEMLLNQVRPENVALVFGVSFYLVVYSPLLCTMSHLHALSFDFDTLNNMDAPLLFFSLIPRQYGCEV